MATTLATLRSLVRERCDQVNSDFVADDATGLDRWINEGHARLHELLIKAYGEEFVETSAAFSTVANVDNVALPADFFILYGVDLNYSGRVETLKPFVRTERNMYKNSAGYTYNSLPRYKLSGNLLRLLPAPSGVLTGTFWYAPQATTLTAGSDSVTYPNKWETFIVDFAAIKMMAKEESDTREIRADLQKMEDELAEIAQRRNADQPHSAVDTDNVDLDPLSEYIYRSY